MMPLLATYTRRVQARAATGGRTSPYPALTTGQGWRAWLDVIGGPTATSTPVLVSAFVASGVLALVAMPQVSWAWPALRGSILLVAQLAMVGFLMAARVTVLRNVARRPAPVRTIIVFVVASFGMGLTNGLLLELTGLAPAGSVTGDPTGWGQTMLLVLATLTTDAVRRHGERRNQLEAERRRLEATRSQVPVMLDRYCASTIRSVTRDVITQLDRLPDLSPAAAVDLLKFTGHEVVRPRSHDLATERVVIDPPRPEYPGLGLNLSRLMRDATSPQAMAPGALAVMLAVISLSFAMGRHGLLIGLGALAALAVWGYVGAVTAKMLLARTSPHVSDWVAALVLTTVLAASGLCAGATVTLLGWDPQVAVTLMRCIVIMLMAGWGLAFTRAAGIQFARTQTELDETIRALDWEIARANQRQLRQQRDLASILHGPVQAACNAAAIRLDEASREGTFTPELLEGEDVRIRSALASLQDAGQGRRGDLRLVLRRVQAIWTGISTIDIDAPDAVLAALEDDPACAGAVAQIITEACSNAALHGRAKRIGIRLTMPDGGGIVEVEVEDEGGTQTIGETTAGLGSRMLDEVAIEWELTPTSSGSRLRAVLPTATQP